MDEIREFWSIEGELTDVKRRITDVGLPSSHGEWTRCEKPRVNKGRILALREYREGDEGVYFKEMNHPCALNDKGLWFHAKPNVEIGHVFTNKEISKLAINRLLEIYNDVKEYLSHLEPIDERAVTESELIDMESVFRWYRIQ